MDDESYSIGVGEVARRLQVSRETVHNLADTGVLSYVNRARGRIYWKFFNPDEVREYAIKRGVKDV